MDQGQPGVRETLQLLQEIIGRERGAPLAGAGLAQVEAVLTRAFGSAAGTGGEGGFLSRVVTILLADLRGFTAVRVAPGGGARTAETLTRNGSEIITGQGR